eukprot:982577-Pyramimonas_sp.AAC.1
MSPELQRELVSELFQSQSQQCNILDSDDISANWTRPSIRCPLGLSREIISTWILSLANALLQPPTR